jgi:hypothetical protein
MAMMRLIKKAQRYKKIKTWLGFNRGQTKRTVPPSCYPSIRAGGGVLCEAKHLIILGRRHSRRPTQWCLTTSAEHRFYLPASFVVEINSDFLSLCQIRIVPYKAIFKLKYPSLEYERLKAYPAYTNVKFDEETGGLLAIHKDHNFDPTIGRFGIPRGDYERITAEVLYNDGRSVILASEKSLEWGKMPDGWLDGKLFEIKGIEGNGKRNIEYKIRDASKQGAEKMVLFYYDKNIFVWQNITAAYASYLRNSTIKQIKTIFCVVGNELYCIQQ